MQKLVCGQIKYIQDHLVKDCNHALQERAFSPFCLMNFQTPANTAYEMSRQQLVVKQPKLHCQPYVIFHAEIRTTTDEPFHAENASPLARTVKWAAQLLVKRIINK